SPSTPGPTRCPPLSGSCAACCGTDSPAPGSTVRAGRSLQDDLLAFFQAGKHFGLRAIADSELDGQLSLTRLIGRIGNLDGGRLVFVVKHRAFRNGEDALVFFENDLRISRHL